MVRSVVWKSPSYERKSCLSILYFMIAIRKLGNVITFYGTEYELIN